MPAKGALTITTAHSEMTPGAGPLDVAVVGGGVIGLSVGWRLAAAGARVEVLDPQPASGASWAAAGMLAPVTEAHPSEKALAPLALASAARWPAFAADLERSSGQPAGLRASGTLVVGVDDDDRRAIDDLAAVHSELGLDSTRLSGRDARRLEPLLHPRVRAALEVPGDHQADPRVTLGALRAGLAAAGGGLRAVKVEGLSGDRRRVSGVVTSTGEQISARWVVIAAGVASSRFEPPGGGSPAVPVRPVKGQILRLHADPDDALLPERTVRGLAHGVHVYLVPRPSGELVVGATMEEQGYDTTVTAGAVHDLLRAAVDVLPGVAEMRFEEAIARLRPGTPDNAPVIGAGPAEGLVWATGHYRNGVLLAPITADAVEAIVGGAAVPEVARPFGPERFW